MQLVKIVFRGQGRYKEIIAGDSAGTAFLTRALVGNILITLYKQVIIDHVAFSFFHIRPLQKETTALFIFRRVAGVSNGRNTMNRLWS